jgi:hypothetical protein
MKRADHEDPAYGTVSHDAIYDDSQFTYEQREFIKADIAFNETQDAEAQARQEYEDARHN